MSNGSCNVPTQMSLVHGFDANPFTRWHLTGTLNSTPSMLDSLRTDVQNICQIYALVYETARQYGPAVVPECAHVLAPRSFWLELNFGPPFYQLSSK